MLRLTPAARLGALHLSGARLVQASAPRFVHTSGKRLSSYGSGAIGVRIGTYITNFYFPFAAVSAFLLLIFIPGYKWVRAEIENWLDERRGDNF
ncbi:unnamed protein product [Vitrella brassicaformis CCMP3155]|uniref:Uncharacterized protein n=2 Tax=Vitrella brassicaformis TaxID=1169539 RepID=A0A0G4GSW9_VITBC|nr:unnamed protein product [Vitrella brassicaformis CCMP3155]|eukprot:CEM33742.1 unnamed protein product [Vitrella brassicaformis CCMP3155]